MNLIQTVERQPLAAEAIARSQVRLFEIYGGRTCTETGFFLSLWLYLRNINPPILYTTLYVSIVLLSIKVAKPGNIKESIALSDCCQALRWLCHAERILYCESAFTSVRLFFVAQRSNTGLTRHNVEFYRSRTHLDTHTHTRQAFFERVIGS
jgi:hypothetical protein